MHISTYYTSFYNYYFVYLTIYVTEKAYLPSLESTNIIINVRINLIHLFMLIRFFVFDEKFIY